MSARGSFTLLVCLSLHGSHSILVLRNVVAIPSKFYGVITAFQKVDRNSHFGIFTTSRFSNHVRALVNESRSTKTGVVHSEHQVALTLRKSGNACP